MRRRIDLHLINCTRFLNTAHFDSSLCKPFSDTCFDAQAAPDAHLSPGGTQWAGHLPHQHWVGSGFHSVWTPKGGDVSGAGTRVMGVENGEERNRQHVNKVWTPKPNNVFTVCMMYCNLPLDLDVGCGKASPC